MLETRSLPSQVGLVNTHALLPGSCRMSSLHTLNGVLFFCFSCLTVAFKLCFLCVRFAIKLAFVAGIPPGTFLVWCDVFHSSPVHTVLHILIVFFQWMLNSNDTAALAKMRLPANKLVFICSYRLYKIYTCMYTWIFWSYLPNDSTELCVS